MDTRTGDRTLQTPHVAAGVAIALVMTSVFTYFSSGWSLIVTFIPGVVFSLALLLIMWKRNLPLPDSLLFLGLYFVALSVQFLHFCEEFLTHFNDKFALLYGGHPYSQEWFIAFNMAAYAIFTLAAVAVYVKGVRAALLPTLFFVVYGVLGNAVSHLFWALQQRGYFPGGVTALAYLFLGPLLVNKLLRSRKQTAMFVAAFTGVLLVTDFVGICFAK